MAFSRGPNIIRNGLIAHYDGANIKSFRGEPTTNLANTSGGLIDWTIGNLGASVTLATIQDGIKYRITSTTGGSFRIRFQLSKLVNAETYTMSYKYKIISGGPTFNATDWCDQSITRVTNGVSDYFYETATGSRSTYDSTYRFMDFTISDNTVVEIWDIQLEQKTYATPFTVSERGTTVSTGGGLVDISKNGNHADLFGSPSFNSSNYGGISFDGTSDYGRGTGDMNSYPEAISDKFSIEVWINIPSSATWTNGFYGNIISKGQYAGFVGLARTTTNNQVIAYLRGNTSGVQQKTGNITRDEWHHLVMTYDGGTSYFYINGASQGSSSTAMVGGFEVSSWRIAEATAAGGNVGNAFEGQMSSIKFYNRDLSADEVLQNYNALKTRFGK